MKATLLIHGGREGGHRTPAEGAGYIGRDEDGQADARELGRRDSADSRDHRSLDVG
jgi:hypothetical protein